MTEWEQAQSQPHVPVNAGLRTLEVAARRSVIAIYDEPPTGSEVDGNAYIVADPAQGVWTGREGQIAYYSGGWKFLQPETGWRWYIVEEGYDFVYDGTSPPTWTRANSILGRHAIYIPAAAMRQQSTDGCSSLQQVAAGAGQPDMITYDFDATVQEYAQFSLVMPKKWDRGGVSWIPHWCHGATATNFGVMWQLAAVAMGADDALGAAFGTESLSYANGGTTDDLYRGDESSISIGGTPQPEDMVYFQVSRAVDETNDTLAVDARLLGITLYINVDQETDA